MRDSIRVGTAELLVYGGLIFLGASFTPTSASAVCTGDCNNNGDVAVNELITMNNLIMQEDPDLSGCPNADGDGDEQVMVNDLMNAFCNFFDDGCNGCAAGTGTVAMTIGNAQISPGQQGSVSFSVEDAAGVLSVFQLDVGFDPTDLDVVVDGSGVPLCNAGPIVPSNFDFRASKLNNNPGVRLIVIPDDIVAPMDTLASDGTFATCTFRVNNFPAHGAPWPLDPLVAGAGGSDALELGVDVTSGQITCCGC